jgi:hypothetical protein
MTAKRAEKPYSTDFDWAIYADATLAGLSVLIPIPFLDSLVEGFFRRRMPLSIAQRHAYPISPHAVSAINADPGGWGTRIQGCLLWPFQFLLNFLLKLVRKIVYFLTVKKAVDALNDYWQRAFLLDHMIRMGYIDDPEQTEVAVLALNRVLAQASTSPLRRLAQQLILAPFRMARAAWRAWRGHEDETLTETKSLMARTWASFGDYFVTLVQRYDQTFQAIAAEKQERQ